MFPIQRLSVLQLAEALNSVGFRAPRPGCVRLSDLLKLEGISVGSPTVQSILIKHGMGIKYASLYSPYATTYTYGDTAHKHAVTALSTGETYTYDANGNMTCRVENGSTYKQEYNFENLLSAVKKMSGTCASGTILETTSFVYDGDGNLVKKVKPNGDKTLYVGGIYEVDKTGSSVTRTVTYYPAADAMRINITGGSNTVYYVLKDHLGSASVITDASGNIVGEQRYCEAPLWG